MASLNVPAPQPTILQSGEQEKQLVQGYRQETSDLEGRLAPIRADMSRIEGEVGGITAPAPPKLQPIAEFQPRQVDMGEMMNFAGIATALAALGAKVVRTDVAGALNAAGSAMRGYQEGNIIQTKMDMEAFNTKMRSVIQNNNQMLAEYQTVLQDRRLSLSQKMQQYGVLAHKYQDEIAMAAMRKGDISFELGRMDKIRDATNRLEVQLANMQAGFAAQVARLEAQLGRQSGPQIIQTAQGTFRVDPNTGQATPVTMGDGTQMPGRGTGGQVDRPLPAGAAGKLLENQQNLRRAERALALAEGKTLGEAKGDTAATGWKGYLPEAVLQRFDPEGVDTRAAISDLGSLVIHDRSGAAVTAAEFPRLRPFIPQATDDHETVKKKLKNFVAVYKSIVQDTTDFYTESGYKVPGFSPTGGAAQPPAGGGGPKEGEKGKSRSGRPMTFRGGRWEYD